MVAFNRKVSFLLIAVLTVLTLMPSNIIQASEGRSNSPLGQSLSAAWKWAIGGGALASAFTAFFVGFGHDTIRMGIGSMLFSGGMAGLAVGAGVFVAAAAIGIAYYYAKDRMLSPHASATAIHNENSTLSSTDVRSLQTSTSNTATAARQAIELEPSSSETKKRANSLEDAYNRLQTAQKAYTTALKDNVNVSKIQELVTELREAQAEYNSLK